MRRTAATVTPLTTMYKEGFFPIAIKLVLLESCVAKKQIGRYRLAVFGRFPVLGSTFPALGFNANVLLREIASVVDFDLPGNSRCIRKQSQKLLFNRLAHALHKDRKP